MERGRVEEREEAAFKNIYSSSSLLFQARPNALSNLKETKFQVLPAEATKSSRECFNLHMHVWRVSLASWPTDGCFFMARSIH